MESILLAIGAGDPLWIGIAFLCGLVARSAGLPPLVGFLVAGFALKAAGAEGGDFLRTMADLGITLLLFSIGLKLDLRSLIRPEIWAVSVVHMGASTILMALFVLLLFAIGLPMFAGIGLGSALIIGFALSFSSTVFAVKFLDELGAGGTRHGKTAIGLLIVQDIAAVVFLAASLGKMPTPWALGLFALIPLRHVFRALLDRTGHGELLILYGIVLALAGADVFELVGLKGDLGALVFGMLLGGHPRANEMSKALLGFKDLFLVGFFLSIGMHALPGLQEFAAAMLLLLFLPLKVAMYYLLFARFRLRARTAWRASLSLANYSEFGLIVGSIAVANQWLPANWLATLAIALSASFIIAAPLGVRGDQLYRRFRGRLKRAERVERLPGDEDLVIEGASIAVFGMGRVGTSAYTSLDEKYPGRIIGIDLDAAKVERHHAAGRRVALGDGSNPDFWSRAPGLVHDLEWVLLTLPSHRANRMVVMQLRELGYTGKIAAATRFADEAEDLETLGVEFAFDLHSEAGSGFARDIDIRFN